MIERLRGSVIEKPGGSVLLEVGGLGFRVQISAGAETALPPVGAEAVLFARTVVHRDDGFVLYGFSSAEEGEWFDRLRGVSGVGPAVALNLLALTPARLHEAIREKDVKRLMTAPGVGGRIARRLITELAGSLPEDLAEAPDAGTKAPPPEEERRRRDLVSAFLNLQFQDRRRIEEVVASVLAEDPEAPFEAQFRAALGAMAPRGGS